jgi:protein subunit release factor B
MDDIGGEERREHRRYALTLPMRYRVTPRHAAAVTGTGTTCDISQAGVGFLCREALPEGSHIEVVAEWPARPAGGRSMDLRMTGFVLRSNRGLAAVLVTSHKLRAGETRALEMRAGA